MCKLIHNVDEGKTYKQGGISRTLRVDCWITHVSEISHRINNEKNYVVNIT